jgi:hypothetical protein
MPLTGTEPVLEAALKNAIIGVLDLKAQVDAVTNATDPADLDPDAVWEAFQDHLVDVLAEKIAEVIIPHLIANTVVTTAGTATAQVGVIS